jgi:hypothetical protein
MATEAAAGPCTDTTWIAFRACLADATDNFYVAKGTCFNLSDPAERNDCLAEARSSRQDDLALCRDQRSARADLCQKIGEDAYDPAFNPDNFVDPLKINASTANPYFPLVQGNQWVYDIYDTEDPTVPHQTDTMIVTGDTKLIEGVTCVVVHDQVADAKSGVVIEDTQDWYTQDLAGNVWYCGEISLSQQTFPGDKPQDPEVVDIEGSWKAGREGAKPGILIGADPQKGDVYRQEFLLGTAEDVAEVISTEASETATASRPTSSRRSSPIRQRTSTTSPGSGRSSGWRRPPAPS